MQATREMLEKKKSYCGGNIVIEVGNKRNA
jgi:hypothetical protein